jgi:hypothetical protein
MGRSVSYPTGALVCFEDVSAFEDEFDFEWFTDDLKARSRTMFLSLYECDKWRGREDHILMRNAYADFGISEYCGLAAIWIAERCDGAYYDYLRESRAAHWLTQIRARFLRTFGTLILDGYMSNGEAVYRPKPAPVSVSVSAKRGAMIRL